MALLSLALGGAVGALWASSRGRARYEAALTDRASLAASLDAERRSAADKVALLKDAESKLRDAFAALSADALKQNTDAFLKLARTSLGEYQKAATMDLDGRQKSIETLVQPLKESLKNVDTKLNEVEKGLAQVERGQTVSHEEVGTRLEQRLTEHKRRR